MALLVTGGAGYIGSIVVEKLLKRNFPVVVIDNLQEGNRSSVSSDAFFYKGNCGDKKILAEIFQKHKIEAVLHFAAETTIEYSMTDPRRYFHNNVIDGLNLLNVMHDFGCNQIIFSSTAAIFGEPQYIPIDEKHIKSPINAYGESKLIFEQILDWYHKAYNIRFNSFRYFNAAGASKKLGEAHKHESHLIPILIQVALGKREKIFIFGRDYPTKDGTCIRDYVHVLDIADAHILALNNLERYPSGKYNLGNGRGFSNIEVVKTVEKISDKKVNYEFAPKRAGDPAVLIASSKLAKKELRWKLKYNTLEKIIESAWLWHSTHPHGYVKK